MSMCDWFRGRHLRGDQAAPWLDPRARVMLRQALPAPCIGVGCSLVLNGLMGVAAALQTCLWHALPPLLGATADTWWWILGMLTLTGVVVGLVVAYVPGHGGPDPASVTLIGPPMPVGVLPSLALVLIVGLAGGVSLGPENPIIAINIALTAALGSRLLPGVQPEGWVMLAVAGTIGALFGTPVAAALLLTQRVGGDAQTPMWDRLFAPLVAAGVGAITTALIAHPDFALPITPYGKPQLVDLLSGTLICLVAVAAGLVVLYLFPLAHRQFHRLPHPVLALGSGGCVLGLLGLLGGALSLFKGLDEMQQMAAHVETIGTSGLALLIVVKLAALLVSATCGFRGGRIFPVVFAGTGLGLLTNQLLPAVPVALAIACSVMGFTLVVTRDGWLSIFVGAAVVPSLTLLPVLCLIMLPAWLVVAGQPPMLISAHTPLQPPADQPHR